MNIRTEDIVKVSDRVLPYAHWLYSISGIGSKTIGHILSKAGTPEDLYRMPEEKIESILPHSSGKKGTAEKIAASRGRVDVWKEYQKLKGAQIKFTCIGHADYPRKLLNIPDPPYGIYYRGSLPEQNRPAVALIGARSCSEYGSMMAMRFGSEFAMMGVQVISGMARGIDGIGQNAALEAGGYSLGVLGCGVDICYPETNRNLYDMLCTHGGVCSEYLPGVSPKNSLFPPRNRIISGLSDIVLVIEAKNRSGTLITVDMALEQGKEVYALPGRVGDALSEGCNSLIQQGAGIALSPQDIVKALVEKERFSQNTRDADFLSDIQSELLQIMEETPQPVEKIKERLLFDYHKEVSLPELLNQLMKLSLCGLVKQAGNSYFAKECGLHLAQTPEKE